MGDAGVPALTSSRASGINNVDSTYQDMASVDRAGRFELTAGAGRAFFLTAGAFALALAATRVRLCLGSHHKWESAG